MHSNDSTGNAFSGFVESEGDSLFYEVSGDGPPLLMITGAGGDSGYYNSVRRHLDGEYRIISYDRRGHSRSSRRYPQNFEVSQQARDAVAVIGAAGYQSAYVFGNSAGAIVALEMVRAHATAVRGAVVHEPPTLRILPDSDRWLEMCAGFYLMACRGDCESAMLEFRSTILLPSDFALPEDVRNRVGNNAEFFMKHEFLPFGAYSPDIEFILRNGVPTVIAVGSDTLDRDAYYGRPASIIAKQLATEVAIFPGHHLSFVDANAEWCTRLNSILESMKQSKLI